MIKILLPPSETKRPGGTGAPLALDSLALPRLTMQREAVVDALIVLSDDPGRAQRVLKLSERQLGEIDINRVLRSSPTMAAVDRYTGVLYDALDAASLATPARRWLDRHVWIHAAPFGPVSALDLIPSYRLAAGTALPGVAPLRRHWADAVTAAIAEDNPSFVLDLRSEAYVALGPVPASVPSAYVRVVTESGRALNHFNKKAKGELVRALAEDRPEVRSAQDVCAWAAGRGMTVERGEDDGILDLIVRS
jgi:cytoplasmic iron level regulating protein YaaA (DUF328/UPF0246 family)